MQKKAAVNMTNMTINTDRIFLTLIFTIPFTFDIWTNLDKNSLMLFVTLFLLERLSGDGSPLPLPYRLLIAFSARQ
jgi:hypothetical protein